MARRLSLLKRVAPTALLDKGIRKSNGLTTAPKADRRNERLHAAS
jgi:hypothetical protein